MRTGGIIYKHVKFKFMKKVLQDFALRPLKTILTQVITPCKKGLYLLIASFVLSITVFGHIVDSYTSSCTGINFTIVAHVSSVNNTSNYNWQYLNSSGTWVCLVNGSNTISGITFTASGVSASATVTPPNLSLTNLSASLDGKV